ncbi:MAG TPA: GNAT family N-acetyltransferase, partial [Candidatus Xenobia bacterium]
MIRLARPDDGAALAAIYAPAVDHTPASFEFTAPDGEDMARRIEHTLPQRPWLVAERDGAVLGYAYAGQHRERAGYQWDVNVSVYIGRAWHRRGVGRALYT